MREMTVRCDWESWRDSARRCLAQGLSPSDVLWVEADAMQPMLPGLAAGMDQAADATPSPGNAWRVPPRFVDLAKVVICHRDPGRWDRLYRVLWRIVHGDRDLLAISIDDDVEPLLSMEKQVRFDRHKMTAFVRFRELATPQGPRYVAWYRPDHLIVRLTAPFFAKRFATLSWSILTPDDCAHWDGEKLAYTPGVPVGEAPAPDELETLWRVYYGSIFNPARVKLQAMKKEMPVRFWDVLPEARDIDDLLRDAPRRVRLMIAKQAADELGAAAFLPESRSLESLREAAGRCKGCALCGPATQTVFGDGPANAVAMVIGEQPGDQEDLQGRPFVGPAGQVLDEALAEAGIDRSALYLTNAVKHFKFEPRGKRRIHAKPSAREVSACLPWLEAEVAAVRPEMILCLGNTAAQALLGREFRMMRDRGRVYTNQREAPWLMATLHPSALLRIPDADQRHKAREQFVADLRTFGASLVDEQKAKRRKEW